MKEIILFLVAFVIGFICGKAIAVRYLETVIMDRIDDFLEDRK